MTDIDTLTLRSWAHQSDPIDLAITAIRQVVDVRDTIVAARSEAPNAYPLGAWTCTCGGTVANKVVGLLLDAGWTPPKPGTVAAELRVAANRMTTITDAELLASCGDDPPTGFLASARVQLADEAVLYRRRADELDQSQS